jgi:hypothetical protein
MFRRLFVPAAAGLFLVPSALGLTITNNGNAPSRMIVAGPCTGMGGPWQTCGITSYFDASNTQATTDLFTNLGSFNIQPVGEESFATAFTNFMNSAAGSGWSMNELPALSNITYTINTFNTFANKTGGGVTINIGVATQNGYNGPPVGQLVWTQGLEIDYTVAPNGGAQANPPINTLDSYTFNSGGVSGGGSDQFSKPCSPLPASPNGATPSTIGATPAGTAYCDPIYPFQNGSQGFGDVPSGIYPIDSFRAEAFLSTVNTQTKTLTIYDGGVNYGFDLFVTPEPSAFAMLALGGILALTRRRKARG